MKESVIDKQQNQSLEQQLNSITSQIGQIEGQVQNRNVMYSKCLIAFKSHLQNEVKQFEETHALAESKNKLIQKTYELIYQNVNGHSDYMLRNIRCTQQAKKKFWSEKIKDYVSSPELQFKKELYQLKGDAEDRYLDAIQERKALKTIPFSKLTSQKDRNMTLVNYQNSNRQFQMNTHIGTFLKSESSWKINNLNVSANKQNSMRQPLNLIQHHYQRQKLIKQQVSNSDLLLKFMRR